MFALLSVRSSSTIGHFWFALLTTSAIGCGGVDPSAGSGGAGGSGVGGSGSTGPVSDPSIPILPLALGNTWTYRVTDIAGVVTDKTTVVEAEEAVGGTGPNSAKTAFKMVTDKADGTDRTESWQSFESGKVLRYRERGYALGTVDQLDIEEHWDPAKLRVDGTAEHTRDGATWLEVFQETKMVVNAAPATAEVRDNWSVVSAAESVTVPAGTFDDAIHVRKAGSSTKEYWYVRGIGKVKETGSQTEELVSYEVAP